MIDVDRICCGPWQLVPIESGEAVHDHRPRMRVGGGLSGEVSSVEFREGGVDVVDIEHSAAYDSITGIDLDDVEAEDLKRPPTLVTPCSYTTENESLAASRNCVRTDCLDPDVSEHGNITDRGVPTLSEADVHYMPAIRVGRVGGHHF
ncbi:MAG: hypothetical protein ACXVIQ_14005, partial [Ilumatobacteraceae bacterium]